MITIKIILLLYLAAYVVACSGSDKSAKKDSSRGLSKPLNEDSDDNTDFECVQVDYTGGELNIYISDLEGSGLLSSKSSEKNVPKLNYRGAPGSFTITVGDFTWFGRSSHEKGGIALVLRGGKLWIDGKIVEGLNTSVRTIRLEWGKGQLMVNGKTHDKFKGIEGTGICNILWRS